MRRTATVVLAILLAAGCAAPPTAAPAAPSAEPGAAEGRPLSAVVAALLPVDPCLGLPGERTGPHRCRVADGTVAVVLGQWRAQPPSADDAAVDLGGVAARRLTGGAGSGAFCRVAVPVSPQLAISATADGPCAPAEAVAAAAAGAPAGTPGPAAADRDACTLLTGALGSRADGLAIEFDRARFGLDGCAAQRAVPGGYESPYALVLRYDTLPPVERSDFGDSCTVEWSAGPSGVASSSLLVLVTAPDCPEATELRAAVEDALAGPPPDPGPRYEGSLTYRPGEPGA